MCSYQFIGGVAGPGPDLPGAGGELDAARGAVEVVGVVHLAAEPQRIAIDDGAEEKEEIRFMKCSGLKGEG